MTATRWTTPGGTPNVAALDALAYATADSGLTCQERNDAAERFADTFRAATPLTQALYLLGAPIRAIRDAGHGS
jgi:hypothetical protein